MAQVEPMDIDSIESDFDNKENAFQHHNVLSRTPCTEKGYEELDVSELNMKLRYSITPASSPMTKSLNGLCLDNRNCNSEDYTNSAVGTENGNLTRSLNTSLIKNDGLNKTKVLPLQTLSKDSFIDSNRNSSIRRLLDPSDSNVIIISSANDNDENLSVPSTCSSVPDTPEATTPTKEIPKPEGSPILRGLKSVLSMFRPSQSPIHPAEEKSMKQENFSPNEFHTAEIQTMQVSTPMASRQREESLPKRTSPLKESLIFNDDLEKELQWKNDSSVVFKGERAPVHKLFFNHPITVSKAVAQPVNPTVESMDISCNETILGDQTMTDITIDVPSDKIKQPSEVESENEFLDCENTFTKNESYVIDNKHLDIVNEIHEIGGKVVDVPQNAEIPREIASDNKNTLNNTVCIESGDISKHSEQASVLGTDLKTNTADGNVNIIDVTKIFLNRENIYNSKIAANDSTAFKSHNVDLEIESQVNSELKLQNNITDITVSIEEHLVDDDVITIENKLPTIISVEHDIVTCENLENKSINIINHTISVQEVCNNIDVCLEKLHNIETLQENCNDCFDTIETNGNIGSVEDISVNVKDINLSSNFSTVDDQTKVIQSVDIIGSTPIIEEPSVTNKTIVSTQSLSMDSNINELNNVEDISNKSINVTSISNDVTPIFNENHEVIDVPIAHIIKNNERILIGNEIDTNLKLSQNFIVAQTDLVDVLNVANEDSISTLPETNITNNINQGSLEYIKASTTLNSPQTSLQEDLEYQNYDETQITCPSSNIFSSLVNIVSDNDRDIPELTISNQMASTNLPSEVPLPIENEIEQNYMLPNNACNKEHIIESLETNPTAVIEDEIISICIEHDNATKFPNFIDTAMEVENDKIETLDKETVVGENLNATQTCITQSTHVEMTEIIDTCSKNEAISNLQIVHVNNLPEENISNDISKQDEEINRNEVQNVLVIQNSENNLITCLEKPTSKHSIDDVVNKDNEISSIILANLENTGKPHSNASEKFEETSVVKTVDQQNVTPEKELDEVDEEIVTSANNSPYVSVSDLTIDVNSVVKKPLEEIDNPFVTGNKLAASPPISPKIVSKGYNFNFDEIDDPFATKTKIRMSPTPDTLNLSSGTLTEDTKKMPPKVPKQINNRRKSQPERKRAEQKKNSSFTPNLKNAESKLEQHLESNLNSSKDLVLDNITTSSVKNNISVVKSEICDTTTSQNAMVSQQVNAASEIVAINSSQNSSCIEGKERPSKAEEINSLEQTLVISTEKSTSSSEQYFSLGTSLGDSNGLMNQSKNVFNLPEIDDVNFNPFVTKSKMRMSPPPTETADSSDLLKQADINNIASYKETDITYNKSITQDSSHDTSSATCSSKNTNDIDRTIKEIATEDEDTVEGPFLDSDEFKDIEKLGNVESDTYMINFHEAPKVEKDENQENGELFIDADAFEFLLNQNKSTTVSDSGKESLFLKFDPLFAKRVSSDGFLAALSKVQKRQSTPKKVAKDLPSIDKSEAGPSNRNNACGPVEEYNEDLSSNVTKPMMVVSPAVSSLITQKKPATPKLNRRSLTFTSPAMAVIDRLLSLSGNASHLENDTSISQVGRERTETDLAITQLRELLAEKEINVHNLRSESKELKVRLAALEVQVRGLETESAERLAKINDLNDRLLEKTKMNKSMATVVEEYERTIASLIAETEQDKRRNAEERRRLIKERDEQTAHLTSMEVSFSDLHSKYEKSKQIILRCKANEDICRKSIQEFQDNFSKMLNNYELLKQHATSKLNHANQELEKMNRAHEAEVLKMNALLKRKELHITSLEETLAQKTKANEELTAICDELINKVG